MIISLCSWETETMCALIVVPLCFPSALIRTGPENWSFQFLWILSNSDTFFRGRFWQNFIKWNLNKNQKKEIPENNYVLMICLSVFHYIKKKKKYMNSNAQKHFPWEGLQHRLQPLITTLRAVQETHFLHCCIVYYSTLWWMTGPNFLPDPAERCFGQ